jgi:Na+-translocating ferredoxin:NAD+ oxidoreductase RnfD subunit
METKMSENGKRNSEVREALAWLASAACLIYLPTRLRDWLNVSPQFAVAAGVWLAGLLFLAIDVRSTRDKIRGLLFATAVCAVIYVAGRTFKFPT